MNKIRISGAIASAAGVTLYLEDGQTMELSAGTWRTTSILTDALPALARHEIVELDLDTFSIETHIEKKTGGLLRFVKEKFSVMKGWLSTEPEKPKLSNLGINATMKAAAKIVPPIIPVNAVEGQERTVAIVRNNNGSETRVPHVERLEQQMERAVLTNDTVGLEKFMKRIASVIKHRGHSVEELLNFMKRGDLPIADDGSIVAYKVLEAVDGEYFVDRHSKKVRQRHGSHVSMAKELVNTNRREECATGLHIARRGYLHSFSGNVITIVKVAPEDVIAVPHNEPDKMRAAAYHIVGVVPSESHLTLRNNKPMTGDIAASKMLADVIKGNHIGIIEHVKINAAKGGDVVVTLVDGAAPAPKPFQSGEATALDHKAPDTTFKDIRSAIVQAVAEKAVTRPPEPEVVIVPIEVPAGLAVSEETFAQNVVGSDGQKYVSFTVASGAPKAPDFDVAMTETPAERRNRVKREKRALQKVAEIKPSSDVLKAARSGDMSAAISSPAPVKVAKAKPVASNQNEPSALTDKQKQALDMIDAGKSQRQVEKELNISPKTIRKLLARR